MNETQNKRLPLLICFLLALAVLIVYAPVRHHDFVNYDDGDYVYENPDVQSGMTWRGAVWAFRTTLTGNWHPLTWLSHMLDCQIYGTNPGAHHVTNVLIHAATSVFLFLLLKRMTRTTWRSAFVAALFALHPLRVESVAWVSERKDVLAGLFWMLTMWMYVRYVEVKTKQQKGKSEKEGIRFSTHPLSHSLTYYSLALLFFVLGLMSKPMLVTLPFVLLLLDFWPLHRAPKHLWPLDFRLWTPLIREKIPFFILTLVMNIVTYFVQGKAESLHDSPLSVALTNVTVSYQRYIRKMFWPSDLACIYPSVTDWPVGHVVFSAVLLVGISVLFVWRVRKQPYLLVGWLWFVGVLVPVIGFVQIGSHSMADRYTYLPEIGLAIILAWGIPDLLGRWRHRGVCLSLVAAAVIGACLRLTHRQVGYWCDSEILFTRAIEVTPNNPVAYNNRGYHFTSKNRDPEAMADFQTALKFKPVYADAQANLGAMLGKQGKTAEALDHLHKAIQIMPLHSGANNSLGHLLQQEGRLDEAMACFYKSLTHDPNFAEAHHNLGDILAKKGDFARAVVHYEQAIRINPAYAKAYNNLGLIIARHGYLDQAIAQYEKAIQVNPAYTQAYNNRGIALAGQGKLDQAELDFAKVIALDPTDAEAQNNLGNMLAARNKLPEAIEHYSAALQIKPDYVNAHNNLGMALARQGMWTEAMFHYNEMIRLDPADAGAYSNLGDALSKQGKIEDAIRNFRKALELQPDFPQSLQRLAWVLSTQQNAQFRDGAEAVKLAEKAASLTQGKDAEILDTLAATYAEKGRFAEAMKTAQHAAELAEAAGNKDLAEKARARFRLYQSHQPFRQ